LRKYNAVALNNRKLLLVYEDLVGRLDTIERMVLTFLGVSYKKLVLSQLQLHKGDVKDLISNPDEVERTLRNTPFAWMYDY